MGEEMLFFSAEHSRRTDWHVWSMFTPVVLRDKSPMCLIDGSSILCLSGCTGWMQCVQSCWDNFAIFLKEHTGKKHTLKALYLRWECSKLLCRHNTVSKTKMASCLYEPRTNLVTIHSGPLVRTEPCWLLHLPHRLGRWKTGFASWGEAMQECISHNTALTLMKLYWNVFLRNTVATRAFRALWETQRVMWLL